MARTSVKVAGAATMFGVLFLMAATPAAAAEIFWADWAGAGCGAGAFVSRTACSTPFTATGTITTATATVNVTYQNNNGVAFYNTGAANEEDYWTNGAFSNTRNVVNSPYTSTEVDNIPTNTDLIALAFVGSQTLTFSEAIANPVFAFVSLNSNGYGFLNQDFEILSVSGVGGNDCGYWGCGTVTKQAVAVAGGTQDRLIGSGEPHGVIRFLGAFNTLTWSSLTSENWNGITVGVQGTATEVFPPSVPEPASLLLLGMGLVGVAMRLRRRA